MAATGADVLFTVKNSFWLGNYQNAINEGAMLTHVANDAKAERDVWVYRSYVALKEYSVVLDEVPPSAEGPIACVRTLAHYMSDKEANRDAALKAVQAWMADAALQENDAACVIAANIYNHEHDFASALRCVRHATLAQLAMTVQILLRMDRVDLAAKKHAQMAKLDDDSTITLLMGASVALAQGGDGVADAVQSYKELIERFHPSQPLLNGLGAALMIQGKYAEAEKNFVRAMGMGANADTLVNMIACAQQLGKPKELTDRNIEQLRRLAPKHPYVVGLEAVERVFERVASS